MLQALEHIEVHDEVSATGVIENSSKAIRRLFDFPVSEDKIMEIQRLLYEQSGGGYLVACLSQPIRMANGSLHEMALIRGDSLVELNATKQIGREVRFVIGLDNNGIAFVKSYH